MNMELPQSVEREAGVRPWGQERCHCPLPPKALLTLAGPLLVPAETLVGGSGCGAPGGHVLVRAMEVQDEAGQLAWGGDRRDRRLPGDGYGAGNFGVVSCSQPCAGQGDPQSQHGVLWKRRAGGQQGEANKLPIPVGEGRMTKHRVTPVKMGVHPFPRGTHLCSGHHPCSPAGGSRSPWDSHPRSAWT